MTRATLMWENTPETPINANNLSETIDYQSSGKFINFTDSLENYETWADHTINSEWPTWESLSGFLNKTIYNFRDNTVRIPREDENELQYFEHPPTPYNKILEIKANTKISTSYTDLLGREQTLNFDFGSENQVFTIDDLISQNDVLDFESSTEYSLYMFVKYSYVDSAKIKIVKTSEESLSYWKEDVDSQLSPTGSNIISYRKIGGFTTNENKEIDVETIWDLYTYRDEILTDKILIKEDGKVRPLSASDFKVIDSNNLYTSNDNLTVEDALFQTRALVNNLNDRFYTNKRFGFNLQFSHILKTESALEKVSTDKLTIRIMPGFIDILGTQVRNEGVIYLSDPNVGVKINDNQDLVYGATLKAENDGTNTSLYAGVWTVYVDYSGQLTLRHELSDNGNARWIPSYFGWFDTTGKRALGKFKVKKDNGNYIEKYSVVDTFEQNAPINSIHTIYGTLCPDGLMPCDGKWRDIYGIDKNAYNFDELPFAADWGDSWYEETPDYTNRLIRGANPAFTDITSGPYNSLTNAGGADDCSIVGGSDLHSHDFPHTHETGSVNVLPSGVHPGDHQIDFNGSTEYVSVETVADGVKVSTYDHRHNMTVIGGEHSHGSENFSGTTASLESDDAKTQNTSTWPSFREALICIKKV